MPPTALPLFTCRARRRARRSGRTRPPFWACDCWGAGLLWLAVALAVVTALREKAPRPALVLMAVGAIVFALGHARPTGPIGMALFLAGIAWLELRPRQAEARQAVSVRGA
jgi:hypothetical protein